MDTRKTAQVAAWMIEAAQEAALRGRSVPRSVLDHIRALLDPPPSSANGTKDSGSVSLEIDTAEAARILGCSPGYVRRLCRAGRLPARRVGGVWMITMGETDGREDREDPAAELE